jgi:hypothetical protein
LKILEVGCGGGILTEVCVNFSLFSDCGNFLKSLKKKVIGHEGP